MTKEELIAFEDEIAAEFEAGKIPYPVHLAGGNEDQLIKIFDNVKPEDWVLCSWRSHYHALLKGVPPKQVKAAIGQGRSISLCFPGYRFISSGIVGGICPIAVGLAQSIKWNGGTQKVWCFIGDMTRYSGIAMESIVYAEGHNLPAYFITENNGLSVCTDTKGVWGSYPLGYSDGYRYTLTKPHVGTGKWVKF